MYVFDLMWITQIHPFKLTRLMLFLKFIKIKCCIIFHHEKKQQKQSK